MSATTVFLAVTVLGGAWGTAAGVLMLRDLRRRGERVNPLLVRLMLPAHARRYALLTRSETGRVGPLLAHYVAGFCLALLALLAAVGVALS